MRSGSIVNPSTTSKNLASAFIINGMVLVLEEASIDVQNTKVGYAGFDLSFNHSTNGVVD
jgi:hypothetical protein